MNENNIVERVRQEFNFFATLDPGEAEDFLGYCRNLKMPAGQVLWQEGDADNYAAFIVSGRVGIKKQMEFGGKHVIVGTYGKGTVVGELCLLTNSTRTVTAEVIEPADLTVLNSADFEGLLSNHPQIGLKLLRQIFLTTCRRLNRSYDRIAAIF